VASTNEQPPVAQSTEVNGDAQWKNQHLEEY
jgi:hypothetical protein